MTDLDTLRQKIVKYEHAAAVAALAAADAKKKREATMADMQEEFGVDSAEALTELAVQEKKKLEAEIQRVSEYLDGWNG